MTLKIIDIEPAQQLNLSYEQRFDRCQRHLILIFSLLTHQKEKTNITQS